MTVIEDGLMLECRACDVLEDATVKGRFRYVQPDAVDWCKDLIVLIDHGAVHVPSPG
jgi:hypothetical protein